MRYIHASWKYHGITCERLAADLAGLPEKIERIEEFAAAGTIGGRGAERGRPADRRDDPRAALPRRPAAAARGDGCRAHRDGPLPRLPGRSCRPAPSRRAGFPRPSPAEPMPASPPSRAKSSVHGDRGPVANACTCQASPPMETKSLNEVQHRPRRADRAGGAADDAGAAPARLPAHRRAVRVRAGARATRSPRSSTAPTRGCWSSSGPAASMTPRPRSSTRSGSRSSAPSCPSC